MAKTFINGRSPQHKGDGVTHPCVPPDVCKTPSPGGPVPVPYQVVAANSDLSEVSRHLLVEGEGVAVESSSHTRVSGDEAGTAGGVISGKNMGAARPQSSSENVKVGDKGVVRYRDALKFNGNSFNTAFTAQGGTGMAYGDDELCSVCDKGMASHTVLETEVGRAGVGMVFEELNKRYNEQRPLIDAYLARKRRYEERWNELNDRLEEARARAEAAAAEAKAIGVVIPGSADPPARPKRGIKGALKSAWGVVSGKAARAASEAVLAAANKPPELGDPFRGADHAAMYTSMYEQALDDADKAYTELKNHESAYKKLAKQSLAQIEAMGPVLRMDERVGFYVAGYVVGVLICKCGSKLLAAMDGAPTPGFRAAVAATPFTLVEMAAVPGRDLNNIYDAWVPEEDRGEEQQVQTGGKAPPPRKIQGSLVGHGPSKPWSCPAPKLLMQAGAGHHARTISERLYQPLDPSTIDPAMEAGVERRMTERAIGQLERQVFKNGETVPSCGYCQKLLPRLLCDNTKPCGG